MKPNFALSLSFDGIRLLHRAAGGWRIVGDVHLDTEDLAAELAVLRKTATALEPGGLRSKLLLPNEQIKYLVIDTPDQDEDARRTAAAEALDGATPYAVDELVFDISLDGDRTHIAAVARETLAEAEAFAVDHRFHPVSFAAVPGDQPYLGEPFFGPSEASAELLEPGESIEPDGIAVVVIGAAKLPKPEKTIPEAPPEPAVEDAEESAAASEAEAVTDADDDWEEETADAQVLDASDSAPTEDVAAPDEPETPAEPEPTALQSAPEQPEPEDDAPEDAAPEEKAAAAEPMAEPDPAPAPEEAAPEAPAMAANAEAPDETVSDDSPDAAPADPIDETPAEPEVPKVASVNADVPPDLPASAGTNDPIAPEIDPPAPTLAAPAAGFATRRAAAGAPLRASRDLPDNVTAPELPIEPDSSSLTVPPAGDDMPPAPRGGFLSRRRATPAETVAPARAAAVAAAGAQIDTPDSEAERMTIFGARNTEVGGKPRFLGLMLTAVLLVFLAGVAAWASVFMDDGLNLSRIFGNREPEITASAPPQDVQIEAPAELTPLAEPEPEPEQEPVQTAALDPELTETDEAVLDALRRPDPLPPRELTEEEVEAKYAATGIFPRAPVVPPEPAGLVNIDDLYLTSIDPVSLRGDAIALPPLAALRPDEALEDVPSPAAAGTQFTLDERGLVVPTPEGALSPDGILVFAGKPPVVPPTPPTRFQTTPEVTQPRPELAGFRPKARPENLIESNERAVFGGLSRTELAEYRPRLRPPSAQQQAAAASAASTAGVSARDTQEAVAAALASTAAVDADPFADATRYAVQASLRPDIRPRNFSRTVQRARRNAPEVTQVAAAATVAPRTVTPRIPSSASVARSATVKNAINLRKVNLIGVYGKPSSRRALVRLGNGRYKKVVVGDRIDGGRVSAIGDSELRYTKGGRSVVLRMPKG